MLALDPDLTGLEVRSILQTSADDEVGRPEEDTSGFDIYHGWGRLNAASALAAVSDSISPPSRVAVYPPRPNPSPGRVGFRYDLTDPAPVSLRIYDVRGRLVHVLLDRAARSAGAQVETWDGRDADGRLVPGGVYLWVLTVGGERYTGKLIRF
jgi:hypothetical protein